MTEQQAVQRVLQIARNEIGYREKNSAAGLDDKTANAGSGNYTKYARDLDKIPGFYNGAKQGYAWCDVFVDWCFVAAFGPKTAQRMLNQPDQSAGAGCLYSAQYFQQAGRFDKTPQPGDQAFFSFSAGEVSHTGIVESVTGDNVVTIEGNSSDGVNRRTYPRWYGSFYGFGHPDWSAVASVSDPDTDPAQDPDPPPAAEPATEPQPIGGAEYQITLRELRQGDEGVPVERLQALLIARGYYCGGRMYGGRESPDGEFGPATEVAVKDAQLAAEIAQDGVVGAETMTVLLTT